MYAPCACSPLGKIQAVSQPYAPGAAEYWTTYTYDGIGRTLTATLPDGASTTTYWYMGWASQVTDPAAGAVNWKSFETDVSGNLIAEWEPDPLTGSFTSTTYTYDWMNHLIGSSMTRAGTTQTRTFVYNSVGQLTSATNPESGTVSYTYNTDKTLQQKMDADGQATYYNYDSFQRVISEKHYYHNVYGYYVEDVCQRIAYTYDSNPINPYFSQYAAGRLTTVQYGDPSATPAGCATGGGYTEMYSYHPAGGVTVKELQVLRPAENDLSSGTLENGKIVLDVGYTYDAAGRRNSITYPQIMGQTIDFFNRSLPYPVTYTTTYDSMGRPLLQLNDSVGGVAWAYGAQYDPAGRMTSVQYPSWTGPTATETMSYNVNGQLTSRSWGGGLTTGGVTYYYSGTQNNGQITQMVDSLSGETVSYQYDALKRLTTAASTPNAGTTPAAWTQTYQYDGFGNLTAKVLNGTTTPISVDPTTNRLSGTTAYDANGNLTSGGSNWYDGRNRWTGTSTWPGDTFFYDPSNHRVFQSIGGNPSDPGVLTLYGAYGERLASYGFVGPILPSSGTGMVYSLTLVKANVWFNGRNVTGNNPNPMTGAPDGGRCDTLSGSVGDGSVWGCAVSALWGGDHGDEQ